MDIIDVFNKVKPPYNVNEASQHLGLEALQGTTTVNDWIRQTVEQKAILINAMKPLAYVEKIFESDANFILVKVKDATALYDYLAANEVIVRNRSKDVHCANSLRFTIGTPAENTILIKLLTSYEQQ
jgi:histidinol-phosphate aminotransferase